MRQVSEFILSSGAVCLFLGMLFFVPDCCPKLQEIEKKIKKKNKSTPSHIQKKPVTLPKILADFFPGIHMHFNMILVFRTLHFSPYHI